MSMSRKFISLIVIICMINMIPISSYANGSYYSDESEIGDNKYNFFDDRKSENGNNEIYYANNESTIMSEPYEIDVTKYHYEVAPILSPFCYYVYVKTDNPDPNSFRLIDHDSVYDDSGNDSATWSIREVTYADVTYEDPNYYRVKNGYIFYARESKPDGGKIVVQQRLPGEGTPVYVYGGGENYVIYNFEDTNITIDCPKVKTYTDALIDDFTNDSMSFFEKLDAIQSALGSLAVYPRTVKDSDKPNESRPWPLLAASPYPELGLNEHYETMFYNHSGGMLLQNAYPYVLDSLGFPGTISEIAEKLAPDCVIEKGNTHSQITVTYEGQSKFYGGAGSGNNDPIYTKRLSSLFTFDASAGDMYSTGTVNSYYNILRSFDSIASSDSSEYRDLIAGNTFVNTIRGTGGTWIRIMVEGYFGSSTSFAYEIPTAYGGCTYLSDAWVDGHYIGENEYVLVGEKFENHPNSDIVVSKMHYTDVDGVEHTQDVLFSYNSTLDKWMAFEYYYGYIYGTYEDLPSEFVLTRAQVESMNVDGKTDSYPSEGLVYDGTEYPGTPFMTLYITFVANNGSDESRTYVAYKGEEITLPDSMFSSPTSPEGQVFKSWKITDIEYQPGDKYTFNEDATVTAVWYVPDAKYRVQVVNGTAEKSEYVEGETVRITANNIKGKKFIRWDCEDVLDFSDYTSAVTSFTMPSKSVIVKAVFADEDDKQEMYKVSFNVNGGLPIEDLSVQKGTEVLLNKYVPERNGYTFDGWYSDKELTKLLVRITPIEDTVVHAKWIDDSNPFKADYYTLKFETNGGLSIEEINKEINTEIDLSMYKPVRNGYTFDGWYTDEELTELVVSITLSEDTTVYAKWIDGEHYTLKFETNGGSSIENVEKKVNTEIDLSSYKPARSGYTFDGWYSDKELKKSVTKIILTENMTIYAKWTLNNTGSSTKTGGGGGGGGSSTVTVVNHTLTFNTNGGSSISSITRESNTVIDLSFYRPTREGYTFNGWFSDSDLKNGINSVKLTSDETIYAKWTKIDTNNGNNNNNGNNSENIESSVNFTDVSDNAYYANAVKWAVENNITTGKTTTTFAPDDSCTRAQMVTFLWRAAGSPEPTSSNNPFTDVDESFYYGKAVLWAVEKGITTGMTATEFAPDAAVDRGQTVTFIYRAVGSPIVSSTSQFTDVGSDMYYSDAVNWAISNNITQGVGDNMFSPSDDCTRGQIVTLLYRYYGK